MRTPGWVMYKVVTWHDFGLFRRQYLRAVVSETRGRGVVIRLRSMDHLEGRDPPTLHNKLAIGYGVRLQTILDAPSAPIKRLVIHLAALSDIVSISNIVWPAAWKVLLWVFPLNGDNIR